MDPQQQFDDCLKLADFHFRSFDTRRQFEWKVNFGIWTLVAVGVGLISTQLAMTRADKIGFACALLGLHAVWVFRIVKSNWKDQENAWGFRKVAEELLRDPTSGALLISSLPSLPNTKDRGLWDLASASLPVVGTLVLVVALFVVSPSPKSDPGTKDTPKTIAKLPSETRGVELPLRSITKLQDGSFNISGHWKLAHSEAPAAQMQFGAMPLNSTTIRCWPEKRRCEEYRAQITKGLLFPSEPILFTTPSWQGAEVTARAQLASDLEYLLRIDLLAQSVELEFYRQASPGREYVFERFVLE